MPRLALGALLMDELRPRAMGRPSARLSLTVRASDSEGRRAGSVLLSDTVRCIASGKLSGAASFGDGGLLIGIAASGEDVCGA